MMVLHYWSKNFKVNEKFYLISGFQGFIQLLAHSVMLDGQEGRVQDDAQCHGRLDQGRVDDLRPISRNNMLRLKKQRPFYKPVKKYSFIKRSNF